MSDNYNSNVEDKQLDYNLVKNYFDQSVLTDNSFFSLITFTLYFPVGIVLLLIRFILLNLLRLVFFIFPKLKSNSLLISLTCIAFGVHVKYNNLFNSNSNELIIFVSNHVTCLDYLSVKAIINNVNYMNGKLTNGNSTIFDWIASYFRNILVTNSPKEGSDFFEQQSNYPFLFFPENAATNGKHGLLLFDSKPFDLQKSIDQNEKFSTCIVPICLKINRSHFLPISVNSIGSSGFFNLFLALFVPFSIYELNFLNKQYKNINETSDAFAERVRRLMANNLKLICQNLNHESLKQIFFEHENNLRDRRLKQESQQQKQITKKESSMC
jgi:hypothetical protein